MPDYEGESRELTLDKSMSYSMFTYDVLRVTIPSSPIKSVSTSKEDMLTIFYDEGSHEITVMSEVTGQSVPLSAVWQARRRRQRLYPYLQPDRDSRMQGICRQKPRNLSRIAGLRKRLLFLGCAR